MEAPSTLPLTAFCWGRPGWVWTTAAGGYGEAHACQSEKWGAVGVDAYIVEVEVDLAPGLPAFTTVGLPETAVKESKDRVKAAVKNSGYQFPGNRITINLI